VPLRQEDLGSLEIERKADRALSLSWERDKPDRVARTAPEAAD